MKAREGKAFTKWLRVMCYLDKRLTLVDYNKLYSLYSRSK